MTDTETLDKAQQRCKEQDQSMLNTLTSLPEKLIASDEKPPQQTPVSAHSYQKMTPEEKKLHFPVNRAMRRKQGIR